MSWLYKIVSNVFLTAVEHRNFMKRTCDEYRSSWAHVETCRQPEPIHYSDEVTYALERLPAEFRQALVLQADGASYKDIAAEMDIPIGTVMSRLHRGRRILKKVLAEVAVET